MPSLNTLASSDPLLGLFLEAAGCAAVEHVSIVSSTSKRPARGVCCLQRAIWICGKLLQSALWTTASSLDQYEQH